SVTGIAGVTALVVAVNAALVELAFGDAPARRRLATTAVAVALAAAAAAWGAARIPRPRAVLEGAPRVLVVDGAAQTPEESTLERYVAATGTASAHKLDLLVW